MNLPAQRWTPRWNPPRRISLATPRKRRISLSQPSDFVVRWTRSVDRRPCTPMPPLENLPNFSFLPRRWRRIGKMAVAARTAAETVVKTAVTTSAGKGTALAKTPGTPASATPEIDLLWNPGGTRRVTIPALAQISLAETTDVAVTGVGKKIIKIALQNPHLQLDQPRRYNLLFHLSQDHSISRFLQYIIWPQANSRRKSSLRACPSFRPAPATEKTPIVNATRRWTPRAW